MYTLCIGNLSIGKKGTIVYFKKLPKRKERKNNIAIIILHNEITSIFFVIFPSLEFFHVYPCALCHCDYLWLCFDHQLLASYWKGTTWRDSVPLKSHTVEFCASTTAIMHGGEGALWSPNAGEEPMQKYIATQATDAMNAAWSEKYLKWYVH